MLQYAFGAIYALIIIGGTVVIAEEISRKRRRYLDDNPRGAKGRESGCNCGCDC